MHGAIDANFQLKNLEQVKEYLKAAQKFCEKNPLHLPQVLRFAHYEIQLSIQNNASEAFLSKQLPKYEATIETLNLHDQLNTQLFYGWSALAALFTGQELVSENLVEKMRESPEDKAAYLLAFSRILEFVIYFETPNFQKINQFLGRSKKEKKIKLPEADKVFFDCFLRFVDELATDPRSAQVMAQQFLEKIGQIPPGGHLIQLFKTFRLDDWLRAIVKESAFIEELSIA